MTETTTRPRSVAARIQATQNAMASAVEALQDILWTIENAREDMGNVQTELYTEEDFAKARDLRDLLIDAGMINIRPVRTTNPRPGNPILTFSSTGNEAEERVVRDIVERMAALGHDIYEVGRAADPDSAPPMAPSSPTEATSSDSDATVTDEAGVTNTPDGDSNATITNEAGVTNTTDANNNSEWYYVVLVGRQPGVFKGSNGIQANLSGVSGSSVCRFRDEQEARDRYKQALKDGDAVRVSIQIIREILRPEDD